jgi:hypothetical protein
MRYAGPRVASTDSAVTIFMFDAGIALSAGLRS